MDFGCGVDADCGPDCNCFFEEGVSFPCPSNAVEMSSHPRCSSFPWEFAVGFRLHYRMECPRFA